MKLRRRTWVLVGLVVCVLMVVGWWVIDWWLAESSVPTMRFLRFEERADGRRFAAFRLKNTTDGIFTVDVDSRSEGLIYRRQSPEGWQVHDALAVAGTFPNDWSNGALDPGEAVEFRLELRPTGARAIDLPFQFGMRVQQRGMFRERLAHWLGLRIPRTFVVAWSETVTP